MNEDSARLEGLKHYKKYPADEKLKVLRSEAVAPIASIRGCSRIVKEWLQSRMTGEVPEDIAFCIDRIIGAAELLKQVVEILSDPNE